MEDKYEIRHVGLKTSPDSVQTGEGFDLRAEAREEQLIFDRLQLHHLNIE